MIMIKRIYYIYAVIMHHSYVVYFNIEPETIRGNYSLHVKIFLWWPFDIKVGLLVSISCSYIRV